MAKLLKASTKRPSDMCARYGGEEFVVVYGNTDTKQAQALLEQLIIDIRALAIPNKNSPTAAYVTVSVGLASIFPNRDNTKTQLIKAADGMLYRAKQSGRDQLICEQSHSEDMIKSLTQSSHSPLLQKNTVHNH